MNAAAAVAALLLADPGTAAVGAGAPSPRDGNTVVERFQGVARTPDGAVAYVESHVVVLEGGRVRSAETRYERPDGRTIARLVSAYAPGSFTPDYEFEDLRTGAREGVRRTDAGVELRDGDRAKVLPMPDDVPLVAGQGLDRYARANLGALARGEVLRVSLALPGRLDAYDFRLRAETLPTGRVRVRIEPSSFILRLLAPSLEAEYDPATGRLLRYEGVSNLQGDDGSRQRVEIVYSHAIDPSS